MAEKKKKRLLPTGQNTGRSLTLTGEPQRRYPKEASWSLGDIFSREPVEKTEEPTTEPAAKTDKAPEPKDEGPQFKDPALPGGVDYSAATRETEEALRALDDPEATDFAARFAQVRADYEAAKNDLEKRETIEAVIHGLTNIAAGLYGIKNDIGIGPIEFEGRDWERKRDRALAEKTQQEGMLEREKASEERKAERVEDKRARLKDRLTEFKTRKAESNARRAMDIWTTEMRKNQAAFDSYMKAVAQGQDAGTKQRDTLKKDSQKRVQALQKAMAAFEDGDKSLAYTYATEGGIPNLKGQVDTSWFDGVWDKSADDIIGQAIRAETIKQKLLNGEPIELRHKETGKVKLVPADQAIKGIQSGAFVAN